MGGQSLILLDTHCLIWMDQADARMGLSARGLADAAIEANELAVSVISFWDVALLVAKGRLRMRGPVARWRHEMLERGVVELPLGGGTCMPPRSCKIFTPTRRSLHCRHRPSAWRDARHGERSNPALDRAARAA